MSKAKQPKMDTSDPREGNDDKFAEQGTPLPRTVRAVPEREDDTREEEKTQDQKELGLPPTDPIEPVPETDEENDRAARQAIYQLPDTPNPGDPTAITGTAVPLTSTSGVPAAVGATGDLTGTPLSRRGFEKS